MNVRCACGMLLVSGSAMASEGLSESLAAPVAPARLVSTGLYELAQDEETEKPAPFYTVHSGFYARFSGLVVEQLNDVRELSTGDQISFDTGWGITVAGGYRDPTVPFAFEIEYAYRRVDANDDRDGRLNLNTLSANVLFDASDLVGPVGVYAGAGVGVRIDQIRITSRSGSSEISINGDGLFWQAMEGVTVSVHDKVQLYGGVRFTDAGTYEDDEYRFHSEALNYEFGLRIFF